MIRIFYENKLHMTCGSGVELALERMRAGPKLYNHAYVQRSDGWYRMDGTPCLIEDVPPTIKALALLLS